MIDLSKHEEAVARAESALKTVRQAAEEDRKAFHRPHLRTGYLTATAALELELSIAKAMLLRVQTVGR